MSPIINNMEDQLFLKSVAFTYSIDVKVENYRSWRTPDVSISELTTGLISLGLSFYRVSIKELIFKFSDFKTSS